MPKTVFISGIFNIIHPGHLRLMKYAYQCGDKLIVGVLSDNLAKNNAHISEKYRVEALKLVSFVDEVILLKKPKMNYGPQKKN